MNTASDKFHMILSRDNPEYFNLPGIGVLIGGMWVANLYYWGFNQYIIQRALAAKSLDEAQRGLAFAGFLKLIIPLIVVIPGIIVFVMYSQPEGTAVIAGVQDAVFISKENGLAKLKEQMQHHSALLENLNNNPLPDAFEITISPESRSSTELEFLADRIANLASVDEVEYGQQWIKRFSNIINLFQLAGYGIGGLFFMATVFIVANTIRLVLYSRRDEIEIFKLVGATDWFVKIPFLLEGAIQGILSRFIALFVLFLVYSLFSLKTVHIFGLPVMDVVFLPYGYTLLLFVFSLVLGLTGSFIAVGRFFRLLN